MIKKLHFIYIVKEVSFTTGNYFWATQSSIIHRKWCFVELQNDTKMIWQPILFSTATHICQFLAKGNNSYKNSTLQYMSRKYILVPAMKNGLVRGWNLKCFRYPTLPMINFGRIPLQVNISFSHGYAFMLLFGLRCKHHR